MKGAPKHKTSQKELKANMKYVFLCHHFSKMFCVIVLLRIDYSGCIVFVHILLYGFGIVVILAIVYGCFVNFRGFKNVTHYNRSRDSKWQKKMLRKKQDENRGGARKWAKQ
jgi:hypothetical protein